MLIDLEFANVEGAEGLPAEDAADLGIRHDAGTLTLKQVDAYRTQFADRP